MEKVWERARLLRIILAVPLNGSEWYASDQRIRSAPAGSPGDGADLRGENAACVSDVFICDAGRGVRVNTRSPVTGSSGTHALSTSPVAQIMRGAKPEAEACSEVVSLRVRARMYGIGVGTRPRRFAP